MPFSLLYIFIIYFGGICMKKIAFTGHRPQTLGGGYDWNTKINQRIIKLIKHEEDKDNVEK